MVIAQKLLEILVCPLSKASLLLVENRLISTDAETRRAYSIKNGIPIMLIEEAESLSKEEWERLTKTSN